ncbi:hypothetical protein D0Y65_044943 [Glycine soja]|uniref:Uncharacterized protein n=1 Tax=Glycine soja TaxID=3848 RepID=A0A445G281_GLYSO|nr:hypothetical protein D0Y65_044943 [Glycine soja]
MTSTVKIFLFKICNSMGFSASGLLQWLHPDIIQLLCYFGYIIAQSLSLQLRCRSWMNYNF